MVLNNIKYCAFFYFLGNYAYLSKLKFKTYYELIIMHFLYKTSLCLLLVNMLLSCSTYDMPDVLQSVDDSPNKPLIKKSRSIDEAIEIAEDAIKYISCNDSRSKGRVINRSSINYMINRSSRSADCDTVMYVINFNDEEGFALVAYDKDVPGLIAITDMGNYSPENGSDIPGFELFVENTNYLLSLRENGKELVDTGFSHIGEPFPGELAEFKTEKIYYDDSKVEPNLNIRWGQTHPEGELFENGLSGCTNTAMAIMLSYMKRPQQITLTFPGHENEILELNWDKLLRHVKSGYSSVFDMCDYETHITLSKLCRELGQLNHSVCELDATSTIVGNQISTFRQLGFSVSSFMDCSFGVIKSTLDNGGVLYASGRVDDSVDGHGWVFDGYIHQQWWSGEYVKQPGEDWVLVNDHGVSELSLAHVNWGWDGMYNGYFMIDYLVPDKSNRYDHKEDNPQNGSTNKYNKFNRVKILTIN